VCALPWETIARGACFTPWPFTRRPLVHRPLTHTSLPSLLLPSRPPLPGRNVLARAKNGTGKTAAFCIPILQALDISKKVIQAVVFVPTRELALQTASVLKSLGKHINPEVVSITGGNAVRDDILRLSQPEGVHILVGTPGRIRDLAGKNVARLGQCRIVVLDEADKLLEDEFREVIEAMLVENFPKQASKRQILLFSATFPMAVKTFRDKWMPSPYEINLMDELTLKGVTQFYCFLEERQKVHCLNTLFSKLEINQVSGGGGC
jgi:ATP-dependent RNA helicase DDX6/DHH1